MRPYLIYCLCAGAGSESKLCSSASLVTSQRQRGLAGAGDWSRGESSGGWIWSDPVICRDSELISTNKWSLPAERGQAHLTPKAARDYHDANTPANVNWSEFNIITYIINGSLPLYMLSWFHRFTWNDHELINVWQLNWLQNRVCTWKVSHRGRGGREHPGPPGHRDQVGGTGGGARRERRDAGSCLPLRHPGAVRRVSRVVLNWILETKILPKTPPFSSGASLCSNSLIFSSPSSVSAPPDLSVLSAASTQRRGQLDPGLLDTLPESRVDLSPDLTEEPPPALVTSTVDRGPEGESTHEQ